MSITRRARDLGFSTTVGILHDGHGQLRGLTPVELDVYRALKRVRGATIGRVNDLWLDNLAHGEPNDWRCRAGARYLYVDESGLVHYCSQQRGVPGIPLESYTVADIRREYRTPKACSAYCTVNCAQQAALVDRWRGPQAQPVPLTVNRAGLGRDEAQDPNGPRADEMALSSAWRTACGRRSTSTTRPFRRP